MHPLAPLLILLTVLLVFGSIGYVVYTVANDVADKTSQKMQKKNVVVTKDGMKVGLKEVREESYVDHTQRYVLPREVGVWALGCGFWEEMLMVVGYAVSSSKHGITRAGRHTSHGFGIRSSRRCSSGHRMFRDLCSWRAVDRNADLGYRHSRLQSVSGASKS